MSVGRLFRLGFWAVAAVFLADVLRRCWIVGAWSIVPFAAAALLLALLYLRRVWRAGGHRPPAPPFVRPKSSDFPAQPRRGIR